MRSPPHRVPFEISPQTNPRHSLSLATSCSHVNPSPTEPLLCHDTGKRFNAHDSCVRQFLWSLANCASYMPLFSTASFTTLNSDSVKSCLSALESASQNQLCCNEPSSSTTKPYFHRVCPHVAKLPVTESTSAAACAGSL